MNKRFSRFWLYIRITILNLAAFTMLYSINQRPPIPPITSIDTAIPTRLSVPSKPKNIIKSGIPSRLVITSLDLDLAVGEGSYDPNNGNWTIDTTKAYYADTSVPVNDNNGTTLIYGHGQEPIFARLPNIQANDQAVVYSNSGYKFIYRYQSVKWVSPTDTSVFQVRGKPKLVLQTCAGPYDSYRSLYTFKLISVEKT